MGYDTGYMTFLFIAAYILSLMAMGLATAFAARASVLNDSLLVEPSGWGSYMAG